MVVVGKLVPQRGPEAYTSGCRIFSSSIKNPPLQPSGYEPLGSTHHHCPRCDATFSRCYAVKKHFSRCIKINGNPDALRWFDHESNNCRNGNLKATVTPSKTKRIGFSIASLLTDEQETKMAMSKVGKRAAMAAENQAALVASTLNNPTSDGALAISNPTAVAASKGELTSNSDQPVVDQSAVAPITTSKQRRPFAEHAAREKSVTLACKERQPRSQKPKTPKYHKQPKRDWNTAQLFNNAGELMPSIPGIDSVTERSFDQGKIMSLRPPRLHDGYYPNGEPVGGSFLMDNLVAKMRKSDDEN